jgi:hypothetical protein
MNEAVPRQHRGLRAATCITIQGHHITPHSYVYVITGKEIYCHLHVGFSAPHKQVITTLVVSLTCTRKSSVHTVIEVCLFSFFLSFFLSSFRSFFRACLRVHTYVCRYLCVYIMYVCIYLCKGCCWTSLC